MKTRTGKDLRFALRAILVMAILSIGAFSGCGSSAADGGNVQYCDGEVCMDIETTDVGRLEFAENDRELPEIDTTSETAPEAVEEASVETTDPETTVEDTIIEIAPDTTCVPACTPDNDCGPNGCGGVCGFCNAGWYCEYSSVWGYDCVEIVEPDVVNPEVTAPDTTCVPDCAYKACGPDGCGGICGSCPSGELCVLTSTGSECLDLSSDVVTPDSDEEIVEPDSDEEIVEPDIEIVEETTTDTGEDTTNPDVPCVPDCSMSDCGDDGCGGSCGVCSSDEFCAEMPDHNECVDALALVHIKEGIWGQVQFPNSPVPTLIEGQGLIVEYDLYGPTSCFKLSVTSPATMAKGMWIETIPSGMEVKLHTIVNTSWQPWNETMVNCCQDPQTEWVTWAFDVHSYQYFVCFNCPHGQQ
jgi:hypothetical protein